MTEDQLEQEALGWLAGVGYTLLPHLISSQLRLLEAEAMIEESTA